MTNQELQAAIPLRKSVPTGVHLSIVVNGALFHELCQDLHTWACTKSQNRDQLEAFARRLLTAFASKSDAA